MPASDALSPFERALRDGVLLADGAMGTRVQEYELDVKRDYWGCENCTDVLTLSRPDIIRAIHESYFAAGADCVETNSFGASILTLDEFGLGKHCHELNKRAAELAREAASSFNDGAPRFVLGSIGPGTKLPSLGHTGYQTLEDSYARQCEGLLDGGVDALLIETVQDPLQAKAAINGARRARRAKHNATPLACQVTVESTGTLLVGSDIAAAATVLQPYDDVILMGLNCATGPQEMTEHLAWLGAHWPRMISVLPNAGLPEVVDGKASYPLTPQELASWLERFVKRYGVAMVGGCCGTGTAHIQALDAMLRRLGGNKRRRPPPVKRSFAWSAGAASLFGHVPYRQENAFFNIGERCNANGSRRFRSLQAEGDWEGCVAMGREQIRQGAHAIDLCTAFVGRRETDDMTHIASAMRGALTAPLVFDSTELPTLEAALKLYGGKALINSMNFEDGDKPAAARVALARRFGAALIALTIDEEGMAKTVARKVAVAERLYRFACTEGGLAADDLLIDPLTFTICTGNEDDRKLALETLDAIEALSRKLPACQLILGLSNVSFGINEAARHVLNSVFLDEALKRGLTGAIVHAGGLAPLHKIAKREAAVARDLIHDSRRAGYDPLHVMLEMFSGRQARAQKPKARARDISERLNNRIVDGDRKGLEADLDKAMKTRTPLEIINGPLLSGMKVVGELFGAGQMQLPFVLQSAETMKKAVAWLEPFMEKATGEKRNVMVLATVRGDVHDIGKNLVDIILSNNGYKVVNLGIKQPLSAILEAVRQHEADVIGMSGLLVKSTVVMRENLEEMARLKMKTPVILGGAALNLRYVVEDCAPVYDRNLVAYAKDAFAGLRLMDSVTGGRFGEEVARQRARAARHIRLSALAPAAAKTAPRAQKGRRPRALQVVEAPPLPFFGDKLMEHVPLRTLLPYLNLHMLYQFHWGYRKGERSREEFTAWSKKELKPQLNALARRCEDEEILQPQAAYGYWPCRALGNDLALFAEDCKREVARFTLPRQKGEHGLCLADYFRNGAGDGCDVVALQVVTIGARATEVARQWFAEDRYRDYLYLHGLGVEMAEALAEYVHKRIRRELGFALEDAEDPQLLIKHRYRGARYSFGYPACPNLSDQKQILELLGAGRIGISMSEGEQLEPEQSTSALVAHHPDAGYFVI